MAPDCVGPVVEDMARKMPRGGVLLLENLRFHAEEEANDAEFARALASLADVYVNDAFGSAHRAHASTVGVTAYLPAVAGFLMEKELAFLGQALAAPARPFVAVLGGAKVSDKIEVIHNLLGKVDSLLIGGGMANTFLKAEGKAVGESLVENDKLEEARTLLRDGGSKLILPVDVVVADRLDAEAQTRTVSVDAVPAGWRILDIGPETYGALHTTSEHGADRRLERAHGSLRIGAFRRRNLCDCPRAGRIVGSNDHHWRRRLRGRS